MNSLSERSTHLWKFMLRSNLRLQPQCRIFLTIFCSYSRTQISTNTQLQKWARKDKQTVEQRMKKLQFADTSDIQRSFISIQVSHYKLTHLMPNSKAPIIILPRHREKRRYLHIYIVLIFLKDLYFFYINHLNSHGK